MSHRRCAHLMCSQVAAATLVYDYVAATAVVEPLAVTAHPMSHDLCGPHAEGLVVPRGWVLADQRRPAPDRSEIRRAG